MKSLLSLLALTACAICSAGAGSSILVKNGQPSETRGNFIPSLYDVGLHPFFGPTASDSSKYTTSGTVTINARPLETTTTILLDARDITIGGPYDIDVRTADMTTRLHVSYFHFYTAEDILKVVLHEEMEAGEEYRIQINFKSYIRTSFPKGLYATSYISPITGEEKEMVSTLLEPNNAKSLFPCFDDPQLKANFTVMIGHYYNPGSTSGNNLKVVTSLEKKAEIEDGGVLLWVTYHETPPMYPSMLSFAIVPEEW